MLRRSKKTALFYNHFKTPTICVHTVTLVLCCIPQLSSNDLGKISNVDKQYFLYYQVEKAAMKRCSKRVRRKNA